MEEYKLYITALRRKGANDKIEPVIIEQFRELLAEQFDMYYQAWIEHNVELLEKILYDQKYLRKSFSDELKNIPDQIEIMAGQFVQTYNIFNKIYQNEAAKKSISDDIRGIEKSSKYAITVLSYLYKHTNAQHKDIAEYCGIPLSTLSDLLKKFEEINCVERWNASKYSFFKLTVQGRNYVRKLIPDIDVETYIDIEDFENESIKVSRQMEKKEKIECILGKDQPEKLLYDDRNLKWKWGKINKVNY